MIWAVILTELDDETTPIADTVQAISDLLEQAGVQARTHTIQQDRYEHILQHGARGPTRTLRPASLPQPEHAATLRGYNGAHRKPRP